MRSRATNSLRAVATVERRNSSWILVSFAGNHHALVGTPDGFDVGQRVQDAVWRFIKINVRGVSDFAASGGQRFEPAAACAGLLGRNPMN